MAKILCVARSASVSSVVKLFFQIEYNADFSWLKPSPTSEESVLQLLKLYSLWLKHAGFRVALPSLRHYTQPSQR